MSIENFLHELHQNGYEPVKELRANTLEWPRLKYNGESAGKASGGYRLTQNPDGTYFANYGSSKDPMGFRSWKSDKSQELSWEEISAAKAAREQHRRFLEEKQRLHRQRIGRKLAAVLEWMPVATDHPYLTDKQVGAHGIYQRAKTGELVIPRYGIDGKIYSIQTIKQKSTGVKSWKQYFKGALGKDLMYLIGDAGPVLVIAEGFATGASIHEATGLPVAVCFDAGSLVGVARGLRGKYPDARIIIAGDNDQWVFASGKKPKGWPDVPGDDPQWAMCRADGLLYNPGAGKARAAAAAIGGAHVLLPPIPENHPKKITDWNDLMIEQGKGFVKKKFDDILEIPRVIPVEEAPAGGFSDDISSFGSSVSPDVQPPAAGEVTRAARRGDMGMNFRVLGYNKGVYYYYPFKLRQIVELTASSHSMNNLIQLDCLEAWEAKWRGEDGKLTAKHQTIALYAADHLQTIAKNRGVFAEEDSVRGAGCWVDDGRLILHCGDRLYIDGQPEKFEELESDYIYIAAKRLMKPAADALSNSDARRLRTICESCIWENPLSGTLLAGWLVVAPVCAALQYRPHIYITGETDAGKSTVVDMIIKRVLGKMALCMDGGTTEPKIREAMGADARPLIYDEAENSASMADVIMLARKASTGATVAKFGQRPFKARFCACFSAINPPVNKTADENRISFMHLKKNRRPTAMAEYDLLLEQIADVITDDFSERMLARTLQNINSLIANIRIFQREVRRSIGGGRASQQIGSMLAGVYMLGRTDTIYPEAAAEIVSRFTYTDHTIIDQESDPVRLLQWIAGALLRTRGGIEMTVGYLITQAKHDPEDIQADKLLRSYGILVEGDAVKIASTGQNLARLLRDTDWHAKWSRTLTDIPGAEKLKSVYFSPGFKTSAISVPLKFFIEEPPAVADETDWWPEDRE